MAAYVISVNFNIDSVLKRTGAPQQVILNFICSNLALWAGSHELNNFHSAVKQREVEIKAKLKFFSYIKAINFIFS